MANVTLSRALADCLEALDKGESLESCLGRYPQYRQELRSLLQVALALKAARKAKQPSPTFIIDLKQKLTKEVGRKASPRKKGKPGKEGDRTTGTAS